MLLLHIAFTVHCSMVHFSCSAACFNGTEAYTTKRWVWPLDINENQRPHKFFVTAEMDFFDFDDMALEKSDIWQELFPARWGPEA